MSQNLAVDVRGSKMQISAVCTITGRPYVVVVDHAAWRRWTEGQAKIQEAFPDLDPAQREFVKTSTTPAEWESMRGTE